MDKRKIMELTDAVLSAMKKVKTELQMDDEIVRGVRPQPPRFMQPTRTDRAKD